jgi:hypothetical protein
MKLRTHITRFALLGGIGYLILTVLSLTVAHVLLVFDPQSSLAESIIAPVARGLAFLDTHWKAALLVGGPFILPLVRSLVPRLRKAWGFEFDLPLEPAGEGEVPTERGAPK